jgi:hypothetical protein
MPKLPFKIIWTGFASIKYHNINYASFIHKENKIKHLLFNNNLDKTDIYNLLDIVHP